MLEEKPLINKGVLAFVIFPEWGGYYPTFKLARALKESGYNIIYFGTSEFKETVVKQGFEFQIVFEESFGEGTFDGDPLPDNFGVLQRLKHNLSLRRYKMITLYQSLISGDLVAVFKRNNVDAILVDALLVPIAVIAHKHGFPIISVATELVGSDLSAAPHFVSLISGNESLMIKIRIKISWIMFRLRTLVYGTCLSVLEVIFQLPNIDFRLRSLRKKYRKIERESGLDFFRCEYGLRPKLPEVVLCPAEFEYDYIVEKTARKYLGHCIDLKRVDDTFPWSRFDLDKNNIIYCSLGTHVADYSVAVKFLREILKVADRYQEFIFIVNTGRQRQLSDYGKVPANVHSFVKVPQLDILKRSRVAITNGGLGTIKECIYFSVPMLVIPCMHDQPGNGARVNYHEIGICLDAKKITADIIGENLKVLLFDNKYKTNISRKSTEITADSAFTDGVEFIESEIIKNLNFPTTGIINV